MTELVRALKDDWPAPVSPFECVDYVRLEAFDGYAMAMRHLPVEMLDQLGDVLLALPQRGDAEGGDG